MERCFFGFEKVNLFFFLWLFTGLDFFPFLSGDNQVSRGKSSPMADTLWHGCIGEGGADV